MLAFRLIARLDIRNEHLITRVRFDGTRKVGDPAGYAEHYNEGGIDELIYNDCVASLYRRSGLHELLDKTTEKVFCPVTAAGGIRSVDDASALFDHGADKICLNTGAIERPQLITELALKYGSQAVVLQLDVKRLAGAWPDEAGDWEPYIHGGRQPTGVSLSAWAVEAVERGAGEILLTSIDREGVRSGFDLALIEALPPRAVPVVVAGGFGAPSDAAEAYRAGMSGIAIAGALHYGDVTLDEIRGAVQDAGGSVRWRQVI